MDFWSKLEASVAKRNSLLCVGLDPRADRLQGYASVADLNCAIIDATADIACLYKPNMAFYEALGDEGLRALRVTLERIPADIPVLLDAKRNDISATAWAYAQAVFDVWGVDAVTINPYLGRDGVDPFLDAPERGVFVLCKTSNPSSGELQDRLVDGQPLYLHVAALAQAWAGERPVGLVTGATYPEALAEIRAAAPRAWLLIPGVGAQGGELEAVLRAGLRADGAGVVVNASRSLMYAASPHDEALRLRDAINAVRADRASWSPEVRAQEAHAREVHELARELFEAECVCFGDFVLHSGAHSPIYIDLRRLVTYPALLARVARSYARLLARLQFDRIAAIPYAALPIGAAVALQTGRPLIYPRREAKAYGTRRQIEGAFHEGETAVVLDDLISSGGSKWEAIQPLQEAGLTVRDVVVLLDREQGGREDLAQRGYRLHATLTLRELVDALATDGLLSAEDAARVRAYLAGQG